MFNKGFIEYKKKIAKDISAVDSEILRGVSMSELEWFDFNTKSALLGYWSRGMRLYRLLNRKLIKLAEVYAEAMSFAASIEADGFTMGEYEEMLKHLSRKMNRLIWGSKGVRVKSFDRNGKFYISMTVGDKGVIEFPVDSKSEAQKWIISLIRCSTDLVDSFPISKEFRKYLNGYLGEEIRKIKECISPMPYVDYLTVDERRTNMEVMGA